MLDTDTPDNTSAASDGAATPEQPAPAPRKRAPRKATARRTTLPAADALVVDTAAVDAPAAGTPAADAPAAAPRKRAPRKTAARTARSATPTEVDAAVSAPEVVPETGPEAGPDASEAPPTKRAPRKRAVKAPAAAPTLETQPVLEVDTSDAPPAKKAARKRAAKKVAVEPAAENATDATTTSTSAPSTSAPAAMSAPGVLFMAPDGAPDETQPAPARRRRTAKKAAAPIEPDATDTVDPAIATTEPVDADTPDEDEDGDPDDLRDAAIEQANGARRRRRRGRRGRGGAGRSDEKSDDTDDAVSADDDSAQDTDTSEQGGASEDGDAEAGDDASDSSGSSRRRRRRRRSNSGDDASGDDTSDPPNTVTHVREKKSGNKESGNKDSGSKDSGKGGGDDGVRGIKGSTRLEAKRQRRRDGRETTRRRAPILTEAEFLARREAVDRVMAVRQRGDRTQIAVLEDGILVEHYVTRASATSYVGNVYLGKVQNVLPSMEAAFVDIGKGRNGVLYAGEVNWDAAGLDGKSRTIEHAMKSGDSVLVQVTKDPIGHKGARLTSQVSLPGRFLVYVPGGGMTGISRRLPDTERHRLKSILKKIVPDEAGVIVRTAAEGASEEDLTHDVERLQAQWESIEKNAKDGQDSKKGSAPLLLHGEPDLAIRVVRDVFNEDFTSLVVDGEGAWSTVSEYVGTVAPDLGERVSRHVKDSDLFHDLRVDEQLAKALDRKVWLPSGGSLVIDRTEAMTVVDVNTGRFVGSGGNLEQTVTRNNLEAAEEIVRQLRLRDVGGIVVIDFIDMVLESNRDLVLRRLTECLGRDRTKHQVAEVTSLGLVQMTRKRVGEGLLEAFSEPCEHCHGRGVLIHSEPVDQNGNSGSDDDGSGGRKRGRRGGRTSTEPAEVEPPASPEQRQAATAAIAAIHRATSTTDDAGEDGTPSTLTTLANDLVNAAMDAGLDGATADPGPVSANGRHEGESSNGAVGASHRGAGPESAPEPETAPAVAPSEAVTEPLTEAVSAAEVAPSETEAATPPRRRRRAASRPAGPPVHA